MSDKEFDFQRLNFLRHLIQLTRTGALTLTELVINQSAIVNELRTVNHDWKEPYQALLSSILEIQTDAKNAGYEELSDDDTVRVVLLLGNLNRKIENLELYIDGRKGFI